MEASNNTNKAIILPREQGRIYHLGGMTAIFKADESETDCQYSISEWWLNAKTDGPAAHLHEDKDQIFYVLLGTISVLIDDNWIEAESGTFIRIPKNTLHTFANRTAERAGMLNIDFPGGFERNLPAMVQWFEENQ